MDAPRQLSFLSYAVNGSGLGHLMRQVAIQRWLRRYAAFCGTKTAHWFLTTSEADTLLHAEGFAGFKLPSKSVVEESGIGKQAYITLAKQWVWNSLGLIRPDVLLVDTFPNGSFHELAAALDIVAKKALVLRPVKEDFARRGAFSAVVGLYDKVIVPAFEEEAPTLAQGLELSPGRLRFVGPIFGVERFDLLPRDEARARLGIPEKARAILVSGGGGGDDTVQDLFEAVDAAVADFDDVHVVFAAGPLFRGRDRLGPRRSWLTGHDLARHLPGIDVAVCAAGFNTFHELAFAGVPTVFVPQQKVADDQRARAQAYVDQGAARLATLAEDGQLRSALRSLLDDDAARAALGVRARALCPDNHARRAAAEVLALAIPRSLLRQAQEVVDDDLLARCGHAGLPLADVVDVAVALAPTLDRAVLEVDDAFELLRSVPASATVLVRIAQQLQKKVRQEGIGEAVARLLHHPALAGQWSGLSLLLQALSSERVLPPQALVEEIIDLIEAAAAAGLDVFSAARLLEKAQSVDEEGRSSNKAALRDARAATRATTRVSAGAAEPAE